MLRSAIREFTPPIIWKALRKTATSLRAGVPPISGVYESPLDIPNQDQWEGELWHKQQLAALKVATEQPHSYLPRILHPYDLTALYLNQLSRTDRISVLDFGGAGGFVYYHLRRGGGLLHPENVDWTVVDAERLCKLGESQRVAGDLISFAAEIPSGRSFDVIHVSSVFQYINDIDGILKDLAKTHPKHLVFTRLFGGDTNPEYFSKNYAFGRYCPLHVFNIRELERAVHDLGFVTVYRSVNIHEQISPSAYHAVPISHQIQNTSHLFFTRQDGSV